MHHSILIRRAERERSTMYYEQYMRRKIRAPRIEDQIREEITPPSGRSL